MRLFGNPASARVRALEDRFYVRRPHTNVRTDSEIRIIDRISRQQMARCSIPFAQQFRVCSHRNPAQASPCRQASASIPFSMFSPRRRAYEVAAGDGYAAMCVQCTYDRQCPRARSLVYDRSQTRRHDVIDPVRQLQHCFSPSIDRPAASEADAPIYPLPARSVSGRTSRPCKVRQPTRSTRSCSLIASEEVPLMRLQVGTYS